MRPISEETCSKGPTNREEAVDTIPAAQEGSREPALPVAQNNRPIAGKLVVTDDKKPRKAHGGRRQSSAPPGKKKYAAEPIKRERSDKTAAQDDE